jgi:hypothetical protein
MVPMLSRTGAFQFSAGVYNVVVDPGAVSTLDRVSPPSCDPLVEGGVTFSSNAPYACRRTARKPDRHTSWVLFLIPQR